MKTILTVILCLSVCACRSNEESVSEDPMRAQRASAALSKAIKAEEIARIQSQRERTSQHAAASYRIAAERADKAREEAKAAGMTDLEIQLKSLDAAGEAMDEAYKDLR